MRMAASLNRDLIESVKQHGGDAMCEWQIRTGPVALLVGAVRSRVDRMEHEAVEVQVVGCLGEAIALVPVPLCCTFSTVFASIAVRPRVRTASR